MDTQIPGSQLRRETMRRLVRYAAVAAAVAGAAWLLFGLREDSVPASALTFSSASTGDIDISVAASGTIAPAFEEIILSPVSSRVIEVCHRPGDIVDAGTPLLRLDLASARADYDNLANELQMKRLMLDRLIADNRTRLSDMDMRIKVARMQLRRREAELRNERYLDSIGSGTTDRVRETELAFRSEELQLEQLCLQRHDTEDVSRADEQVAALEIDIMARRLAVMEATLLDAEIRSPRRATLTSVVDKVGSQVAEGSQVAVVADLGHYRVDAEVAEGHASALSVGAPASVAVGGAMMPGRVTSVEPTSRNGIIGFTVTLDNDSAPGLRAGLRPDIYVSRGLKRDVMRIANASYYSRPGTYTLYVREGDYIVPRRVCLGEASYDHVEVVSGLRPGEEVVISPMDVKKRKRIKN